MIHNFYLTLTCSLCRDFTRTLVFCNTVKSCRAAEFGLREVDIPTLSYHGEVPSDERTRNLDRFKAGDVKYLVSNALIHACVQWIGAK